MILILLCCAYFTSRIVINLRRNQLSIKFVYLWLVLSLIGTLLFALRNHLQTIAQSMGFVLASNALLVIFISILFAIILNLSVSISKIEKKLEEQIIESALIRSELYDKNG